jgi:hypothetical protein
MAETYSDGTTPRISDTKRVKWAKWLILKGGTVRHTNSLRQIMAKLLQRY